MASTRRRQFLTLRSSWMRGREPAGCPGGDGTIAGHADRVTWDNGLLWGEHRWIRKEVPYEEALRVPLVMRYDGWDVAPRVDDRLALNIDIAPTSRRPQAWNTHRQMAPAW